MINIVILDGFRSRFFMTPAAWLLAIYALAQAHWPLAACMTLIASGYRRIIKLSGLSRVTNRQLILVISSDASVQLKSGNKVMLQGSLKEQQWCTSHMAVLGVSIEGKSHHFAALSAQQTDSDSFRRLRARLRYNFYPDTNAFQVPGN